MRKYYLASNTARQNIDLTDYLFVIIEAVNEYMPKANVTVYKDYYCVSPTPKQGDAVKIGRKICESTLKEQCIYIPKLFCSKEVPLKEVLENDRKNYRKPMGGHH